MSPDPAHADRATTSRLYAHLRAGACDIAVPAEAVVQAVDLPAGGLAPLPRRQGALAGLIELDGAAVPVVALDRWVAIGASTATATARVVVLRSGGARIGIQVDALIGIQRIDAASIRTVCHDADDDELFESVVPAIGEKPLLCLLEVARLMALAATWCAAAEIDSRPVHPDGDAGSTRPAVSSRYALFTIGDQLWAIPAAAIARLETTPHAELYWAGQRTCGIGSSCGRKLPLVDLAVSGRAAGSAGVGRSGGKRPWMAVLTDGPHALGVVVSRCERMLDLAVDRIVPAPGAELLAGTALVPGLGNVSVLDIERLFAAVPEVTISRATSMNSPSSPTSAPKPSPVAARGASVDAATGHDSHYLVFEADRAYATPIDGVIGVAALPAAAIDDLAHGRRATLEWRGQTLGVVSLPPIDGSPVDPEPRLAVVLGRPGEGQAASAIAIRSLVQWLPARTVRRSTMRMHAVGEVSVIMPPGAQLGGSLVVVDLAQMAYLLD